MKRLLLAFLIAISFCSPAQAWDDPKTAAPDTIMTVRWEGSTDLDMMKQVRSDIETATAKDSKIKVLKVFLASPGGPVLSSLEIARLVRSAEAKGLIVEFHAEVLCASGCTFVLAAGTNGHRFIEKTALFLVHPPQAGGGFGPPECINHVATPKTTEEKATDVILEMMRDSYMLSTGHSQAEVEGWITCGNEQVGQGDLAVKLNMADATEV